MSFDILWHIMTYIYWQFIDNTFCEVIPHVPAEGGAGLIAPYGEVTGPLPRCSSVCVQLCWGCHVCLRHRVTNCASVFDVFCSRNGLWRNSRTKALRMCRSLLGFSRLFTTSGNKCENEHGVGRCSCLYATWGVLEMGYQGVLEHRPWILSTAVCVRRVLF